MPNSPVTKYLLREALLMFIVSASLYMLFFWYPIQYQRYADTRIFVWSEGITPREIFDHLWIPQAMLVLFPLIWIGTGRTLVANVSNLANLITTPFDSPDFEPKTARKVYFEATQAIADLSVKLHRKSMMFLFAGFAIAIGGIVYIYHLLSIDYSQALKGGDHTGLYLLYASRAVMLVFIEAMAFYCFKNYNNSYLEYKYYLAIYDQRVNNIFLLMLIDANDPNLVNIKKNLKIFESPAMFSGPFNYNELVKAIEASNNKSDISQIIRDYFKK